jgi:hypothetical protein
MMIITDLMWPGWSEVECGGSVVLGEWGGWLIAADR